MIIFLAGCGDYSKLASPTDQSPLWRSPDLNPDQSLYRCSCSDGVSLVDWGEDLKYDQCMDPFSVAEVDSVEIVDCDI